MDPTTPPVATVPDGPVTDNTDAHAAGPLVAGVVDRAHDLEALADAAAQWLDRLPRGATARERNAVERTTRLVARVARDARALARRIDEVVGRVEEAELE